tara:strand:- start:9312 stop:10244 length:933 start_codon:yes stop_codon:yes gene_type:complete
MFVNTSITLSILIPCYNWDVYQLVDSLHSLCANNPRLKQFEIICAEDGSTFTFNNKKITTFSNTKYRILKNNIGRSRIRNLMAREAKYIWLLFIDCDSKITSKSFINKYISCAINHKKNNNKTVNKHLYYGSTIYPNRAPDDKQTLHWKYGKEIESKLKHINFSSHHFLIQKILFKNYNIKFDESIKSYGYEDVFFIINNQIKAIYIKNPAFHTGLKNSSKFIKDTESALQNLILNQKSIYQLDNKIKIIRISKLISSLFMTNIVTYFFLIFKKKITRNLISKSPSLFLFQFYKLGFFLLEKKRNLSKES